MEPTMRIVLVAAMLATVWINWSLREPLVLEKGAADFEPAQSKSTHTQPVGYEFNSGAAAGGCKRHHVVMGPWGAVTYRFQVPALARVGTPRLSAALSTEHPGWRAPADHRSLVRVLVNGETLALQTVIPDDGLGKTYTWPVPKRLVQPGAAVTVRFEVEQAARDRNGLCIYGHSMKAGVPDATVKLELDGR